MSRRSHPLALLLALLFALGLSVAPSFSGAQAPQGDGKKADASTDSKTGRGAGGGDARGGRGGRGGGERTASVILSATDVYKVGRGSIEAGLPISGDLRPIETIAVRTRSDGILESVLVREGQTVKAGQLLAKFESTEQEAALASAEADRLATQSDFETQKWTAEQNAVLFKAGAIAERDLRTSQQTAEAARARLAASDARLRTAQNLVRDMRVVAPVAGIIGTKSVQNGEQTMRGAALFTLVRNEILELTAALPAKLANGVREGQLARFAADGKQFTGKVARVSPTIDPTSRNVTVYIQIPNPRNALKGNTFSTGQIIARTVTNALVVPQSAVRISPVDGKTMVYKVEGGTLSASTIKTGITDDARGVVEILEGVQERDLVIVGNPGTLGRGMKATVIGTDTKAGGGRGGRGGPGGPGGPGGRGGREGKNESTGAMGDGAPSDAADGAKKGAAKSEYRKKGAP